MPGNIQEISPEVYASWPTPNYVDPVRRTWMPEYAGVLQGLTTLMVATRLWLRFMRKAGPLGLDDALLIPAFLSSTMFTAIIMLACIKYGNDRHTWDVPLDKFEDTALMAWLSELAFLISTCSTKVSVLLFYRRLTEGTFSKRWKIATIAAIVFTIIYCLAFVLVLVFNCSPTRAYWKAYSMTFNMNHDWSCADTRSLNPVSGVMSVVSDLYSVVLPMAMLRHFNISRRKKIALNAVFSLGLLVVAAGSVRTYYLTMLGDHHDITWLGFDIFIWADLEVQLAIICASAPALRVLFRRYLNDPISRIIGTASGTNRSGNRGTAVDSSTANRGAVVNYSRPRPSTDWRGGDEKFNVMSSVTRSTQSPPPVAEREIVYSLNKAQEPYPIRTAADFEAYALQNLQRGRADARRHTLVRPDSEDDLNTVTSESPANRSVQMQTPKSWLDTDDTD